MASFLIPPLTVAIVLYNVVSDLQLAVTNEATWFVVTMVLGAGCVAGLVAAVGPPPVRVVVLALTVLFFIDITFHLPGIFDRLNPKTHALITRDETRIADLHVIKAALTQYAMRTGHLPMPSEYGEGTGLPSFWMNWWDVSGRDGDKDGRPFLDFLVEGGVLGSVPVDPINRPSADGDPRGGSQYVYFAVPPGYDYAGGTCDARPNRWHYLLAITDLEGKPSRPPMKVKGSGCACLWKEKPDFFELQFDYVLCGSLDLKPKESTVGDSSNRLLADPRAAAIAKKQDETRVADLMSIRGSLEKYIRTVGPLPAPREYGEEEMSRQPGFWQGYWDVSGEDRDDDGRWFLDFLVESGIVASVPVDPQNRPGPDGDPRGGTQYVYFVASPAEPYQGGTCGASKNQSTYLLGITDLKSETSRPPANHPGSGCDCLWKNVPNFFQQSFDYVVCGTFDPRKKSTSLLQPPAVKHRPAAQGLAGR